MRIFILLFLATLLLTNIKSLGQEKYTVKRFDVNKGLPQSQINFILPQKNDFLIVATSGGLSEFTGNEFLPINFNKDNRTSKSLGRVFSIFKKQNDTLLAFLQVTETVATVLKNKVLSIEDVDVKKQGMLLAHIKMPLPLPKFLYRLPASAVKSFMDTINYHHVSCKYYNKDTFAVLKEKEVIFYTDNGVYKKYKLQQNFIDRTFSIGQYLVLIDEQNRINYLTPEGFLPPQRIPLPLHYNRIIYYQEINEQGVVILADSTLFLLTLQADGTPHIRLLFNDPNLLINDVENGYFWIKDSNTIVLASLLSGFYVFSKNYFTISDRLKDSKANIFYNQFLMPDNKSIYANNTIFRNGRVVHEKKPIKIGSSFTSLKDSGGSNWIFNDSTGKLTKYDASLKNKKLIAETFNSLRFIYEDQKKRIWIATDYKFGYVQNEQFVPVKLRAKNTTFSDPILFIAQDKQHNFILGTVNGLYFSDSAFNKEIIEFKEIHGNEIRFIKPDKDGNIWICTYGGGLFVVQDKKVTSFLNLNIGLGYIHNFIEDARGNCFIPSNNGLWIADKKSLLDYAAGRPVTPFFYHLTHEDGLRINEFNGRGKPSLLQLSDGSVSLPSMDGLVSFKPDDVNLTYTSSEIIINKILLDTIEAMKINIAVDVPNTVTNIRCFVESAFWGNPENEQIQYQLVLTDATPDLNSWIDLDNSKIITLPAPHYGDYKLYIRKRVNLSSDGFIYKAINISVQAKWHQTTLFNILFVGGLFFCISLFYEYRASQQQKHKKTLERRVQDATEQLQHANIKLLAQNNTKVKLISVFSHDISIPLSYIYKALKYKTEGTEPGSAMKKDLEDISTSTEQLVLLCNNILDWMKLQQNNDILKMDIQRFPIDVVLQEKWLLLSNVAARKKIDFISTVSPLKEISTDRSIFGFVIYNLLSNAVKFTSKGNITISCAQTAEHDILFISDTGNGISEGKLEKINQLFKVSSNTGTEGEQGNGIGLQLVNELARMAGMQIVIESMVQRGTTAKIIIPKS